MRLGLVGFAAGDAVGAFGCAGNVEVAQRGVTEAVDAVASRRACTPPAAWIRRRRWWAEARIFLNRNRLRFSIDCCSGGEDQTARPVGENGFKQRKGGGGVVTEEGLRPNHRLAGFNESSKVEDAVKWLALFFGVD